MFRLVQRCCFRTPLKVQKLTLQRLPQYGRNKIICSSPLPLPLERSLPHVSRSQLLSWASTCVTKAQGFHSSLHCLKKKKPEEPEPQLDLPRHDMKSLKDSPKPALYLSVAGLIPFVSVPLAMVVKQTYDPMLAYVQITYGACIVSFLGGIRWGFALPENSSAKPDWMNLASSIVPPLFAWGGLLFRDYLTEMGVMIIFGLGIALHYDLAVLPPYPRWFRALQVIVTLVGALSLLATFLITLVYPEKQLNNSASRST